MQGKSYFCARNTRRFKVREEREMEGARVEKTIVYHVTNSDTGKTLLLVISCRRKRDKFLFS